jgi:hypothetical protein
MDETGNPSQPALQAKLPTRFQPFSIDAARSSGEAEEKGKQLPCE